MAIDQGIDDAGNVLPISAIARAIGARKAVDTGLDELLLEALRDIRLELTAIRLGVQETLNAGSDQQHDLLEMAQSIRDDDTEEP